MSQFQPIDGNDLVGPVALDDEAWREYDFGGRVYRIENPVALWFRRGGTTNRVVDRAGVAHVLPAPGVNGCVMRWRAVGHPVDRIEPALVALAMATDPVCPADVAALNDAWVEMRRERDAEKKRSAELRTALAAMVRAYEDDVPEPQRQWSPLRMARTALRSPASPGGA